MSWRSTVETVKDEPTEKVASNWRSTIEDVAAAESPGLIAETFKAVDSVTGAPTRAAVGAALDLKNPLTAAYDQFAEDPEKAPTGKDIALKLNISDKPLNEFIPKEFFQEGGVPYLPPEMSKKIAEKIGQMSAADAVGFMADIGLDWTNLVGAGALKAAAKTGKGAADIARKGTVEVAKGAAKTVGKVGGKTVDVLSGTKSGTEAYDSLKSLLTPKVADDFERMSEIARANKIDPEVLPSSVKYGPTSIVSRGERNIAEGPIGEPLLKKYESAQDAIQGALRNKASSLAKGPVHDEIAAGEFLRDAYDRGVDKFFSGIDWSHNAVVANAPALQLTEGAAKTLDSKLNGIEKFAKGRSKRGVTATQRGQADQLMAAVNAVREAGGNYKQLLEAKQMIGEVAFRAKNSLADIPPDVQKLRDLYFAIDDAMLDTVKSNLGEDIAKSLSDNNKAMRDFFQVSGKLSDAIGSKTLSSEKVFQALVKNGDSSRIEALKKVLDPADFQAVKGAFLESLIKPGPDGSFSIKALRSALQSKKNVVRTLFEPQELAEINDLLELGERVGDPVLSSSGTGASNAFRDLAKGASDALASRVVIDNMKKAADAKAGLIQPTPLITPPPASPTMSTMGGGIAIPMIEGGVRTLGKAANVSSTSQVNQDRQNQKGYLQVLAQPPPPPETNIERAKRLNQQNQGM